MNIENLKLFCLVIEEGSLTYAARKSYISQPAATKKIGQLEDEYGALLFERVSGGLHPTHAGEVLYPFAKEIIEHYKRSVDAIHEVTGHENILINVGASLTIGEYLLPRLLGYFKKEYPQMTFSLVLGNTPTILAKLELNEIDIALVEGLYDNDQFIKEKFAEDELILVTSNEHHWKNRKSIQLDDLTEEKMIWREPESGSRIMVERFLEEHGVLFQIESAMEMGSIQSVKSAVEAGLGVSILPKLTVLKELEYGTLCEIPIEGVKLSRELYIVQKPQRFKKIGLTYFADFIRGALW
ncbi:LysR family transcriptional regulator [Bacillus sp. REN16]|uniref:LysR family transcriptional regulator n=1 Tax=Bacillus sp. REN16 TaxID=2887296 RepID=UPI001E60E10A|nr:LysR family transcriptional regulator [Bacillus sp. REN16]MCC3356110.1 LysR family transcriptional regulator [Bacillus sp. REN16]